MTEIRTDIEPIKSLLARIERLERTASHHSEIIDAIDAIEGGVRKAVAELSERIETHMHYEHSGQGVVGQPIWPLTDTNPEADYISDPRDFDDADVPAQPADAGGVDALWEQVANAHERAYAEATDINTVDDQRESIAGCKAAVAKASELGLVPRRVDPEDMDLHASVQSILDQQVWSDLKSADELTTEVLATIAEYQNGNAR